MSTSNRGNTSAVESRIPSFRTVEEEAEFWDTHSFEEFADELEEVDDILIAGIRRDGVLSLRFSAEEMRALDERAAALEIGSATLARTWILEQLGRSVEQSTTGRGAANR